MILGYNTNGFAHHRLADTLGILAEVGYGGVAITLEHDVFDPPDRSGVQRAIDLLAPMVRKSRLTPTIETGSRFILDPRRKHQPTMVSAAESERRRRIEFIKAAVDIAAGVDAECISLWSGKPDDTADNQERLHRLVSSLSEVLNHALTRGVRVALEPEPGMFIETMAQFERLFGQLHHPYLGLTLDVGHVCCLGDGDLSLHVRRWRNVLWNIHVEDMRPGRHEHLMFGDGEVDFDGLFGALNEIRYCGPVHVELSRHSHDAVLAARQSYTFLKPFFGDPRI